MNSLTDPIEIQTSEGPADIAAPKNLGSRIREARRSRDWTLDHLAELVGVSKTSVWSWEHDQSHPRLETLTRLSEALGLSVAHLMNVEPSSAGNLAELVSDCRRRIAAELGISADAIEIKINLAAVSTLNPKL
ncbi:helix-turn-helix domain-containing protein [Tsuneonella sp. HG249]